MAVLLKLYQTKEDYLPYTPQRPQRNWPTSTVYYKL